MSKGRDPLWDALKAHKKQKFDEDRDRAMVTALAEDDGKWMKHTEYHWSRQVNGKRLDYWPTRKKYQWQGVVKRGDVMAFIKRLETVGR